MDGPMKRSPEDAGLVGPDGEDPLEIRPLGGGMEVGRSCIHMTYKGKSILFDCGIHPGYRGEDSIPRGLHSQDLDLSKVDLCLVTHFHLDHIGALPYLTERTNFKGAVFMTYPTFHVMKLLLSDYLRVSSVEGENQLFTEEDLRRCVQKITCIRYHVEHAHRGIRFRCFPAGHVLGAAMFDVNIAGQKILYTGDFSCTDDRHLLPARVPSDYHPDIAIMESTMGTRNHPNQERRERDLLKFVEQTLRPPGGGRGGRVLIPIWALGRAQEIQLILDEHWSKHKRMQRFPIFYTSKMAKKAMAVYRTETQMMNDNVKSKRTNPFNFRFIKELSGVRFFDDSRPCVVMATPGMLQSGDSRFLLEQWCGDPANRVLLCGYAVENTLAHRIRAKAPDFIEALDGRRIPFRCAVNEVSFNGHADVRETTQFVKGLSPKDIILVHGARQQCLDLRKHLKARGYKNVQTPENGQPVDIFPVEKKLARFMGAIGEQGVPEEGQRVDAVLVVEDFKHKVLDLYSSPEDAETFTRLSVSSIVQEQFVPYHYDLDALLAYLRRMFDDVVPYTIDTTYAPAADEEDDQTSDSPKSSTAASETESGSDGTSTVAAEGSTTATASPDAKEGGETAEEAPKPIQSTQSSWVVCGKVQLTHQPDEHRLCVQWESSPESDMLADSIVALSMQVQVLLTSAPSSAPASLAAKNAESTNDVEEGDWPRGDAEVLAFFRKVLEERFGVESVTLRSDAAEGRHVFRIEVDADGAPELSTVKAESAASDGNSSSSSSSSGSGGGVAKGGSGNMSWCEIVHPLSARLMEVTSDDRNLRREVRDIAKNLQASVLPILF